MTARRLPADTASIFLKGLCMGICDIIPGVSGGTIALITGIYERLITAISNVRPSALMHLARWDKDALIDDFKAVDPLFLITLVAGIGVAALAMSHLILLLLENFAVGTYSFFFGLIIASSVLIFLEVETEDRSWKTTFSVLGGFLIGFFIAGLTPTNIGHSLPMLFVTGMIALCAMILPGISGAYITLLFNQYEYLLAAVKALSLPEMAAYIIGGVTGLLLFSRALKYLLKHYHAVMLSLLTGLMLGSTRMLWRTIEIEGGFGTIAAACTVSGAIVIILFEVGKRKMLAA